VNSILIVFSNFLPDLKWDVDENQTPHGDGMKLIFSMVKVRSGVNNYDCNI
jgi:hypothetical protein